MGTSARVILFLIPLVCVGSLFFCFWRALLRHSPFARSFFSLPGRLLVILSGVIAIAVMYLFFGLVQAGTGMGPPAHVGSGIPILLGLAIVAQCAHMFFGERLRDASPTAAVTLLVVSLFPVIQASSIVVGLFVLRIDDTSSRNAAASQVKSYVEGRSTAYEPPSQRYMNDARLAALSEFESSNSEQERLRALAVLEVVAIFDSTAQRAIAGTLDSSHSSEYLVQAIRSLGVISEQQGICYTFEDPGDPCRKLCILRNHSDPAVASEVQRLLQVFYKRNQSAFARGRVPEGCAESASQAP